MSPLSYGTRAHLIKREKVDEESLRMTNMTSLLKLSCKPLNIYARPEEYDCCAYDKEQVKETNGVAT